MKFGPKVGYSFALKFRPTQPFMICKLLKENRKRTMRQSNLLGSSLSESRTDTAPISFDLKIRLLKVEMLGFF